MPILWTGLETGKQNPNREHACEYCNQPCDCEDADECRGCWYCQEERHDRDIRGDNDDDQT